MRRLVDILVLILVPTSVAAAGEACDRYLACRAELLELQWKCGEPSRRMTQHACKIDRLFGEHKSTTYGVESAFVACVSRDSLRVDGSRHPLRDAECGNFAPILRRGQSKSRVNCWSNVVRMTQTCFSLARCCPSAATCSWEAENGQFSEKLLQEKRKIGKLLEDCRDDMFLVLKTPIAKEDAYIAREVLHATQELLSTALPYVIQVPSDKESTTLLKGIRMKQLSSPLAYKRSHAFVEEPEGTMHHRHGISKPKFRRPTSKDSTLKPFDFLPKDVEEVQIEKPSTVRTGLMAVPWKVHVGQTARPFAHSSQPPGFSPFSMRTSTSLPLRQQSVDRDTTIGRPIWLPTVDVKQLKREKKRKRRRFNKNFNKNVDYHHRSSIRGSSAKAKQRRTKSAKLRKLEKIAKSLRKDKVTPKIMLVKQRQGRLIGYGSTRATPPIATPVFPSSNSNKSTADEIYDEILESQQQSGESKSGRDEKLDQHAELGGRLVSLATNAFPLPLWADGASDHQILQNKDSGGTGTDAQSPLMEAFISNNGAWTMEPMDKLAPESSSTITSTAPSTPATTSDATNAPTTSTTSYSESATVAEQSATDVFPSPPSEVFTSTAFDGGWREVMTFNPLEDYVTQGLLDKDDQERISDADLKSSDAVSNDYIDISADVDVVPASSDAFKKQQQAQDVSDQLSELFYNVSATSSIGVAPLWRFDNEGNPRDEVSPTAADVEVTTFGQTTTSEPTSGPISEPTSEPILVPVSEPSEPIIEPNVEPTFKSSEPTSEPEWILNATDKPISINTNSVDNEENGSTKMLGIPTVFDGFGTSEITPSPVFSTTSFDNQLWPLPIHRAKTMGAANFESKPIVLFNKHHKEPKAFKGCELYGKCLAKSWEMRQKCDQTPSDDLDNCSAQLQPLHKLIDVAQEEKKKVFADCVADAAEHKPKCDVQLRSWRDLTCAGLATFQAHCDQLATCCDAGQRCESATENSPSGTRMRLLERSLSLRAASCKFRRTFYRRIVV